MNKDELYACSIIAKQASEQRRYDFLSVKPDLEELSADEFLNLVEKADDQELEMLLKTIEETQHLKCSPFKIFGADPPAPEPRSPLSIIMWWEFRRPAYNLVLGLFGTLTLVALSVLNHAPAAYLFMGALTYGVMANVCYTMGWVLEILFRSALGARARTIGPRLFKTGTVFSILVTLAITIMLPQILFLAAPWPQ